MAEHHPFESNMPPRESSLDDFEKLESFCVQDKLDDDVGNLLGDFAAPKTTDSQFSAEANDPFPTSAKSEDPSKGFDVLQDFDSYYHGGSGARYLGKLEEQEESSKDDPTQGFGFGSKPTASPVIDLEKLSKPVPEVPFQVASKIEEATPMQTTPTKVGLPQTPTKILDSEQVSKKNKADDSHSKEQLPTSTTTGCPFSPGALFDSARLNPIVSNLVYWRDLKKSGIVFGAILFLLISMRFFSLISISAYLTLALLGVTISFRIYKNILQAVQKSTDGHPFRDYLEMDIALPEEKVRDMAEISVKHLNCVAKKIRSLFLVEDLVDSIKLGILLWLMTYVGAWFNGLTLVTIAFVAAFSLPKVYETYKVQIDQYLEVACAQVTGILQIVKSKLPFGQKDKQQ